MKSNLRQRLEAARINAGLTHDQVSKIVGVSRSGYGQWVNKDEARRVNPPAFKLKLFADACKVPVDWLMSDDSDPAELHLVRGEEPRPRFTIVPKPTVAPAARLAENFWRAVEYRVVSEQPELAEAFGQSVVPEPLALTADCLHGRQLVSFSPDCGKPTVMAKLGALLMIERASRKACDKTVLVWDRTGNTAAQDDTLCRQMEAVFGVRVKVVADVDTAAEQLVSTLLK